MKRKSKRHNHLKKIYRDEIIEGGSVSSASVEVLTTTEQRWLRHDILKAILVVLILLVVIAVIAIYQNAGFIVNFTALVARWGGF